MFHARGFNKPKHENELLKREKTQSNFSVFTRLKPWALLKNKARNRNRGLWEVQPTVLTVGIRFTRDSVRNSDSNSIQF